MRRAEPGSVEGFPRFCKERLVAIAPGACWLWFTKSFLMFECTWDDYVHVTNVIYASEDHGTIMVQSYKWISTDRFRYFVDWMVNWKSCCFWLRPFCQEEGKTHDNFTQESRKINQILTLCWDSKVALAVFFFFCVFCELKLGCPRSQPSHEDVISRSIWKYELWYSVNRDVLPLPRGKLLHQNFIASLHIYESWLVHGGNLSSKAVWSFFRNPPSFWRELQ